MKYTELEAYIRQNNLLKGIEAKPGIYAITIDNVIVYIGQSDNVKRRCGQHIYKTQNAMIVGERKYELLLAAQLGGHKVDCVLLEYCNEDYLLEKETEWITNEQPILNIYKNVNGKKVYSMKIEDVLSVVSNKKEELRKIFGMSKEEFYAIDKE